VTIQSNNVCVYVCVCVCVCVYVCGVYVYVYVYVYVCVCVCVCGRNKITKQGNVSVSYAMDSRMCGTGMMYDV